MTKAPIGMRLMQRRRYTYTSAMGNTTTSGQAKSDSAVSQPFDPLRLYIVDLGLQSGEHFDPALALPRRISTLIPDSTTQSIR